MAQKERSTNTEIGEVLKKLLLQKGLNRSKAVLFGSYATQTYTDESDIDLVIVSPLFRDKSIFERVELTSGIGRALVKTFKKPFDLMFYSDTEWEQSCSPVIDTAKKEGRILFS